MVFDRKSWASGSTGWNKTQTNLTEVVCILRQLNPVRPEPKGSRKEAVCPVGFHVKFCRIFRSIKRAHVFSVAATECVWLNLVFDSYKLVGATILLGCTLVVDQQSIEFIKRLRPEGNKDFEFLRSEGNEAVVSCNNAVAAYLMTEIVACFRDIWK